MASEGKKKRESLVQRSVLSGKRPGDRVSYRSQEVLHPQARALQGSSVPWAVVEGN